MSPRLLQRFLNTRGFRTTGESTGEKSPFNSSPLLWVSTLPKLQNSPWGRFPPSYGTLSFILTEEVNLPRRGYFWSGGDFFRAFLKKVFWLHPLGDSGLVARGWIFWRVLKKSLEWVQNGLSTPLSEWSFTMWEGAEVFFLKMEIFVGPPPFLYYGTPSVALFDNFLHPLLNTPAPFT